MPPAPGRAVMTHTSAHSQIIQQPFFADLAPEINHDLAAATTEKDYASGAVLFRNGDRATAFYLILEGEIVVEIPAIAGPALEIQRLGPDSILGWSWLIPPYRWTFQARAEGPTRVLAFDGARILAHCEADPAFGYAVLKKFSALMSERLEAARQRMMDEWNPPGFA